MKTITIIIIFFILAQSSNASVQKGNEIGQAIISAAPYISIAKDMIIDAGITKTDILPMFNCIISREDWYNVTTSLYGIDRIYTVELIMKESPRKIILLQAWAKGVTFTIQNQSNVVRRCNIII